MQMKSNLNRLTLLAHKAFKVFSLILWEVVISLDSKPTYTSTITCVTKRDNWNLLSNCKNSFYIGIQWECSYIVNSWYGPSVADGDIGLILTQNNGKRCLYQSQLKNKTISQSKNWNKHWNNYDCWLQITLLKIKQNLYLEQSILFGWV